MSQCKDYYFNLRRQQVTLGVIPEKDEGDGM